MSETRASQPDAWNPGQYERFRDERSQPFFDLLALVQPVPAPRVIDLGCGTGELTRELHRRLDAAQTLGVDNSPAMLAKSSAFVGAGLSFELAEIADLVDRTDRQFDVVFSNAALQWVPKHAELFAGLARLVVPGGQLAVQVPANDDHPSHVVARELAAESPFREALGGYQRPIDRLEPEAYATLLDQLGFAKQHVRLQVYPHHLTARDEVVEWVRGTLLTDYQKRLPAKVFAEFQSRYRELLLPRLAPTRPYFYPFKRILLWARR